MDGKPSASPLPRVCIVVCLAVLSWVALRVWTSSDEMPSAQWSEHRVPRHSFTYPPGPPLVDWAQFRFPALDVTLDDPVDSDSLLHLLKPRQLPLIASRVEPSKPKLEFELMPGQRPRVGALPKDLDRLTATDGWFSSGADLRWSIFGLNTARVWSELGKRWASYVPDNIGAQTGRITSAASLKFSRIAIQPNQRSPHRASGPQLIIGSGERLAMIPATAPEEEIAAELKPIYFPEPITLLAQLEILATYSQSAAWACEAEHEIRQLCSGGIHNSRELAETFARLERLKREARRMANESQIEPLQTDLRKAHYGLSRRVERWQLAADLHCRQTNLWAKQSIQRKLAKLVESGRLAMGPELSEAITSREKLSAPQRRQVAQAILSDARFASRAKDLGTSLSGALDDDLRLLSTDAIDISQLFGDMEAYELDDSPRVASQIVAGQRQLLESIDERHEALAREISEHYRNANFRLAVSGELLNRWLPPQAPVAEPVRDRIAGSPVRGQSQTKTELFVRLIPDPFLWRVGLEASGEVASRTVSGTDSVSLQSQGDATFLARKLLLVRADGVQPWPAVAEADVSQRLLGITSSYDNVPLMGNYVRSQAKEEYHRRRQRARQEVEAKVALRARSTLDERAEAWISDIEREYRARILQRSENLDVSITPVELRTTDERLIARLRLAGEDHLAAYTPRPVAPADSLLSIQIHETALNNGLSGLQLDNRQLTGAELSQLLTEKFDRAVPELPEAARRTEMHFADDAVQVDFADGKVHLIFAMRELVHDRNSIRNFKVHAYYRPEVEGISAKLVRDGSLQMEGRMRHTERARLHAVFGKLLDEDRPFELVRIPGNDDSAHRLEGLMVTQLVIDDGWLGLSIGPESNDRTALRTRFVK